MFLQKLLVTVLILMPLCGCGGRDPVALSPPRFVPSVAPNPMPSPGERLVLDAANLVADPSLNPLDYDFQWLKDGQEVTGAVGQRLPFPSVGLGDAGYYQVRLTPKAALAFGQERAWAEAAGPTAEGVILTDGFDLEPVDHPWVVTSTADSGPGSLREAMGLAEQAPGMFGIQFRLPTGSEPVIRLLTPLPPVRGRVRILGPGRDALTVDGGRSVRPFFVDGGDVVLAGFTVANGLGKGGDAPGGGGGAAGMGGGLFINKGSVVLRGMRFQGNRALGGGSSLGDDGENGGGAGFGGDSPSSGGAGAGGGYLGGQGGIGHLDGTATTDVGGGPAIGYGAGGGAARGGLLTQHLSTWADNLPGGAATFGGGGGFSVGPLGGGGDGASMGGGGGGSGGRVGTVILPGAGGGMGGWFAGDGVPGDGISPGRGGGGGGLGGAVFLRDGTFLPVHCAFLDNTAEGGQGGEPGLGKGGALFIRPYTTDAYPAGYPVALLRSQAYQGNRAGDLVEDPAFDNEDYYVAQTDLLLRAGSPLDLRYRLYRLDRALGLIWRRPGAALK